MNNDKFTKILSAMTHSGIPQLLISDPAVIYYLTGVSIQPGERMLVLVLRQDGNHRFFINDLFHQTWDLGVPITYYNDTEDGVALVAPGTDPRGDRGRGQKLACPVPAAAAGAAHRQSVNSSSIVDGVRALKTPEEQEKMRIASRLNDQVMDRIIHALPGRPYGSGACRPLAAILSGCGLLRLFLRAITAFGRQCGGPPSCDGRRRGKRGDCVVLDIGGRKDDYCSDMTRTVFLGEVSDRQREIYEIVKEANLRGIAAAKPGARMCDVDKAARDYIRKRASESISPTGPAIPSAWRSMRRGMCLPSMRQ